MPEMTVHFAATVSADYNILTGGSESRWQSRHAVVVQGLFTKRIQKLSLPKRNDASATIPSSGSKTQEQSTQTTVQIFSSLPRNVLDA